MFTVLFHRFKTTALFVAVLLSVSVPSFARADAADNCFNYLNAQDYDRAQSEAQTLLQHKSLDRTDQRDAQLCLGYAYKSVGRIHDALPVFQQVEALSQTTEELATVHLLLGAVYMKLNDLDRAELYNQRALKAYKELGNKGAQATTLSNLGMVFKARGDMNRALGLYQQSLALEPDEAKKPAMLNNIAYIYSARKDYPKAVKVLRQAIEIDRRNGDAHRVAVLQLNLGDMLRQQGKFKEAEKELMWGLGAVRLLGDKHGEGTAYRYLAGLEATQQANEKAIAWYVKAEAVYREIGDTAKADEIANLLAGK